MFQQTGMKAKQIPLRLKTMEQNVTLKISAILISYGLRYFLMNIS